MEADTEILEAEKQRLLQKHDYCLNVTTLNIQSHSELMCIITAGQESMWAKHGYPTKEPIIWFMAVELMEKGLGEERLVKWLCVWCV